MALVRALEVSPNLERPVSNVLKMFSNTTLCESFTKRLKEESATLTLSAVKSLPLASQVENKCS